MLDSATFVIMAPDDQAKASGEENTSEVSKCKYSPLFILVQMDAGQNFQKLRVAL